MPWCKSRLALKESVKMVLRQIDFPSQVFEVGHSFTSRQVIENVADLPDFVCFWIVGCKQRLTSLACSIACCFGLSWCGVELYVRSSGKSRFADGTTEDLRGLHAVDEFTLYRHNISIQ